MTNGLRQIRPAEQGITAEEQAQRLLEWAAHELKGEGPNPHDPPVWGENLTPEVYRIIEGNVYSYSSEDIFKRSNKDYIDRKGRIMIQAVMNRAEVEYDTGLKKLVNVRSLTRSEGGRKESEQWIASARITMRRMIDGEEAVDIELFVKIYNAAIEIVEDIRGYEARDEVDWFVSTSPVLKPLDRMMAPILFREDEIYKGFRRREVMARVRRDLYRGKVGDAVAAIQTSLIDSAEIARELAQLAIDEPNLGPACCAVASALRGEGVWDAFETAVKARGFEIVRDELTQEDMECFETHALFTGYWKALSEEMPEDPRCREICTEGHEKLAAFRKQHKDLLSDIRQEKFTYENVSRLYDTMQEADKKLELVFEQYLQHSSAWQRYKELPEGADYEAARLLEQASQELPEVMWLREYVIDGFRQNHIFLDGVLLRAKRRDGIIPEDDYPDILGVLARFEIIIKLLGRLGHGLPIAVGTTFTITRPGQAGAAAPQADATAPYL